MYKTSYTYDANGNIKNLQRYNAAGVKFDDMDYKYDVQGSNLISNKLYHVNDAIASGIHTADIDDQLGFTTTNITTANNYIYDAIGNLTQDKSEQIEKIKWTVSGKIKKIIRTGISTKPDLEYVYDAMGNRIAKILKPDGSSIENGGTDNPTLWTYTYYVRDAQGNIMANYQKSTANSITSFKLIERSIYGSSRLGIDKTTLDLTASITPPTILNHNLGLKNYELSNHLGNVTTVISDRKIPRSILGTNINFYMPDIVSATDYYPFGMTMQERTFSAGGVAYRFGFNGKENDAESNTQDYGMRIYDGRLGRFLSVDPLTRDYPFYTPYQFAGNTPIVFIDLDGCEPAAPKTYYYATIFNVDASFIVTLSALQVRAALYNTAGRVVSPFKTGLTTFYFYMKMDVVVSEDGGVPFLLVHPVIESPATVIAEGALDVLSMIPAGSSAKNLGQPLVLMSEQTMKTQVTNSLKYILKATDIDYRGKGKVFMEALEEAFDKTGLKKADFEVVKWAKDKNGKSIPVEYRAKGGAEVSVDFGHTTYGPDAPHIGWQTGGKGTEQTSGHLILDEVPAGRTSDKLDKSQY